LRRSSWNEVVNGIPFCNCPMPIANRRFTF